MAQGQTKVVFVDFEYLQKNSPIYQNLDPADVDFIIPIAQDMNLERLIGTALYTKLKNEVIAGTLTGDYKTLLDDYITPALIYFIIVDAIEFNAIKFTNKGLLRKSSDNSEVATPEEVKSYKNKIESFAEYYSQRVIDFICANTTAFPEYNQNTNADDILPVKSGYKSSIFIPGKGWPKKTYDRPNK